MSDTVPHNLRDLLRQARPLTESQVGELFAAPRTPGESFVTALGKSGAVAEEKLLAALTQVLHLDYTRITEKEIEATAREKVPTKVVFQYNVMPMRAENGNLLIAANDPFNLAMIESVRLVTKCRVQLALCSEADIAKALKRYYGVDAKTLDELLPKNVLDLDAPVAIMKEDLESGDQEASVVKFVNQIVWEAFKERATDIHLEPMENDLRIRYRMDGALRKTPVPPQLKRFQAAITSRVKVMVNMDIAERRLPQDGCINVRSGGEEIDGRVSTIPTAYGESASLRLLTRSSIFLGLGHLGLSPGDDKIIRKLVELPQRIEYSTPAHIDTIRPAPTLVKHDFVLTPTNQ